MTLNNMNVINEIKNLLRLDIEDNGKKDYHPVKLFINGKPTKKLLAYNRRLIKDGLTFNYLDDNKFVKIGNLGQVVLVNKKFDKRYKKQKVLSKQQKDLETYGSIISNGNLKNKLDKEYIFEITKEINKKKNIKNSNVLIDLKKMSLKKLLKIVESFIMNVETGMERRFVISVEGTNKWITLTAYNLGRLTNYDSLAGDKYAERVGSDNQFIFDLDRNPKIILGINFSTLKEKKNKPQGSFFKYYHALDCDLSRYDIYSKTPESYDNNCLYIALQSGGLSEEKLLKMRTFVRCGSVPTCKLNNICEKLEIRITLRKPNSKNLLKFGTKGELYSLGLIENHYFIIETTKLTSYSIKNYHDIKELDRWNEIYKRKSNCIYNKLPNDVTCIIDKKIMDANKEEKSKCYARDKARFINSYSLIQTLLEEKNYILKDIPMKDMMENQYLNDSMEFDTLEYGKECCDINKPIKPKKSEYNICFFDFETDTSGKKHVPYLCCADFLGMKITFYGQECGKSLMGWLKTICNIHDIDNLMLVAHNLRYDYTFIMDYLYCLKPVLKGNRLMGGTGRLYYGQEKFAEVHFLDSCNLISCKLAKFGEMFNLDQDKEIMPYEIYTKPNINDRFVDTSVILEYVDKENHEQFMNNIEKWNCGDENCVDIIEYAEQYCKIDVDVLKKGFEQFREWILEVCELDIKNYCSIASLGLDYIIKEGCFKNCFKLSGVPRQFIQKCVVGGRCMTRDNKKWITKKKVADFDAVGLYVSAMARMAGFLQGKPKVIENKSFDWLLKNTDGFFVKVLCLNNPNKKRGFPLLSKQEGDVRDFTNETKNEIFYIDKTIYEDCVKYQGLEFKILSGYYYDEGRNNKINSVITHLFNARLKAKKEGNPIQLIYKLLMNSCYGKCLLKPIDSEIEIVQKSKWDDYLNYNYNYIREYNELKNSYVVNKIKPINEHFNNVYAGVEILSQSKRIMNEVMCLAEDLNLNIYYTDTDSMHIDEKHIPILAEEFKKIYDRELIGKNMGQFHTDFDLKGCKDIVAIESVFLGKKAYVDKLIGIDKENGEEKSGFHIRMKGVSDKAIDHYCDKYKVDVLDLYKDLYENNKLPKDDQRDRYFDLLAGGKCCKFQYNGDMSVSSVSEFSRKVNFTYEKGNPHKFQDYQIKKGLSCEMFCNFCK